MNEFRTDKECRYQFSVTSGTVFHNTRLPLKTWFIAIYLTVASKKGISANQMKRAIGVSEKTAWYLCHRIRTAMTKLNRKPLLGIVIENVQGVLKRRVASSYHNISDKHFHRYLDEIEWRFKNRKNPNLFRDTLKKLVRASNLTYKELIAA